MWITDSRSFMYIYTVLACIYRCVWPGVIAVEIQFLSYWLKLAASARLRPSDGPTHDSMGSI